ncbi:unnamed protein product [Ceratitis capitata]|uniref:(Mediterranean fruit fly) hypothetical protein n=1 Tax=Ceratitis capitata TaxID=7213 RepID=A0A811V3W6_CERCA|nr:unnamed protein product [Ceratitis capitata]
MEIRYFFIPTIGGWHTRSGGRSGSSKDNKFVREIAIRRNQSLKRLFNLCTWTLVGHPAVKLVIKRASNGRISGFLVQTQSVLTSSTKLCRSYLTLFQTNFTL